MAAMQMKGRVWKFGDRVPNDGGLLPHRYEKLRIYDPAQLGKWCMENIEPRFAKEAKPGDVIVAGKRFGEGNAHIQGFWALKGVGVGVLVESLPRAALRACIHVGLPILPACEGITGHFESGQLMLADFETGEVCNLTTGINYRYTPLPTELLEIIRSGGALSYLKSQMEG